MKNLYQKSLVSVDDLDDKTINLIYSTADVMKKMVHDKGSSDLLRGKILAALFYEPSSRTMSSFIAAMQRLGGGFIPLNGMTNTSVAKGETTADTAKVFSSYADVLVVRHSIAGTVKEIADNATVPVINAGDGTGEHPTQALLDSYTISNHFSDFSALHIGLVGDLLNGRTVHSLAKLLTILGTKKFAFISPRVLKMPPEIKNYLKAHNAKIQEIERLEDVIGSLDVIYDTRVQKERFSDLIEYEKLKLAYVITPQIMKKAKKTAVLMHPLPRVGEITPEVDSDPRALYFTEQMRNGMYVRMAILGMILKKE